MGPKDINIFNSLHTVPLKSGASSITSESNRVWLHPTHILHLHPYLITGACYKCACGGNVSWYFNKYQTAPQDCFNFNCSDY